MRTDENYRLPGNGYDELEDAVERAGNRRWCYSGGGGGGGHGGGRGHDDELNSCGVFQTDIILFYGRIQ